MNARFFAPQARRPGDVVPLPPDEAQHLVRVLRLHAGAPIRVFDGRGREFDGTVEHVLKSEVTVRVGSERTPAAEARVAVTLAQAVLKGDKMDQVVRDAVMIGAAAIQPLVTTRSEVTLAALTRAHRRERWERIAVSSAKQCGRAVVPPVAEPIEAATLFARLASDPSIRAFLLAEPSTGPAMRLSDLDTTAPHAATLIIGPEGGWTADELALAASAQSLTLGDRTLRADTMAVIAIAALFAVWKEL